MSKIRTIKYAGRVFDHKERNNLHQASEEMWLTHSRWSIQFEKELAEFLKIKYCLLVNSGSSANLLAFMALTSPLLKERKINRGDEVITVAACFPTTVAPIVQYGAIPVFVDVELETYNINTALIEKAITNKTKAIMLAHTLGNPFNINAVRGLCRKYNLWLIEDNCDSLGSKYNGQYTGTFGDIGTSSFYPPHHITMGEGGAVYTDNPLLNKIMLSMRDWGRECTCPSGVDGTCNKRFEMQHGTMPKGYDHKYIYSHLGYNLKATEMQAAIGVAQLKKLPRFIRQRRKNHSYLAKHLPEPIVQHNSEPSWFGFILEAKNRRYKTSILEAVGIQTRNLFAGNITRQPCFQELTKGKDYRISGSLKNTDHIMNHYYFIGVYPGLSKEDLDYMIKEIKG